MHSSEYIIWNIVKASVCGSKHEKMEEENQDDCHFRRTKGFLIASIADGAGSAVFGKNGAKIASRESVNKIESRLRSNNLYDDVSLRKLLKDATQKSIDKIKEEAIENSQEINEYATTLILVCASAEFVSVIQIGDGAVVVGNGEDNIVFSTKPQQGEYINETNFITMPDAIDNAQIEIWRGNVKNIAIFSDGLQMLNMRVPGWIPYEPFFNPLFCSMLNVNDDKDARKASRELKNFLLSPHIRQNAHDDMTLFLANLKRYKSKG